MVSVYIYVSTQPFSIIYITTSTHILLFTTPTIPPIFKSIAQNSTYFFQKGAFKKKLNHNPWKKKVFFDMVFWIVFAPFWMPLVHSAIAFKAFQYYTEQCPPMHSLHDHVKMSDADTLFFSWENLRLIFRVVNVIVV